MAFRRGKVSHRIVTDAAGMRQIDRDYAAFRSSEVVPFVKGTPYDEVCETVYPDRDGPWQNRVHVILSRHMTTIGKDELCARAYEYMKRRAKEVPIDILSVIAGLDGDRLLLILIFREYGESPDVNDIFDYLGEMQEEVEEVRAEKLVVPEAARRTVTEEERLRHGELIRYQEKVLKASSEEMPFLNALDRYERVSLNEIDDLVDLEYDLLTRDKQVRTRLPYELFINVFRTCMGYITSVERDTYFAVVRGEPRAILDDLIDAYIEKMFTSQGKLPIEDVPELKAKIDRALYDLYIVRDLIDDPEITDIKITSPDSIRVRVKGKAYMSNIHFIDDDDYQRFIMAVAVRNNIDLRLPTQTFTDETNRDYILRFTITSPYIMSTGYPSIHIRKVSRKKMMAPDLIRAGMMDEKIRDYLLDCGKMSRGVVFAGPPGSGKTIMLNWFLEEAYEAAAEILVIQESDELFTNRKGVIFEHVIENPQKGEQRCTLEDLGKIALVAGANVFIIGEAKGAEICSAITLSNAGCRTAITIHSPSSTETIDRMADLALRGYAESFEMAKRMMKSFETIVYLKDFKVQEITQIIGYDEARKDMVYRPIYRRSVS